MRKSSLLVSILAALPACSETHQGKGCMFVESAEVMCRAKADVRPKELFLPGQCGDDLEISEVLGEGKNEELTLDSGEMKRACCYSVEYVDSNPSSECAVGRPYRERGSQRRAPVLTATSGGGAVDGARAAAWVRAGADEHASVAAFGRLALQLMAHGAPSELLRDVHRAALEEVGHAELCWTRARRLGASVNGAGAFPFAEAVRTDVTLVELAADAVREGCVGETLGAHLVRVASELAPEPEISAALDAIADEEAEHAVLSYRIVAWALRHGGEAVRAAVEAAFAEPLPHVDASELALRAGVDVERLRRAADEAVREVVAPARVRLLAA